MYKSNFDLFNDIMNFKNKIKKVYKNHKEKMNFMIKI